VSRRSERDSIEAGDFADLVQQLVADAVADLRDAAHAAVPEAIEPHFETPGEAATALRDLYPARGEASAALADYTRRSRRTAQTWLRDTPPGRVADFIAAVMQLVFTDAQRRVADEEQRLLAEAEEAIEEAGDALAADELAEFRYADVGAVTVDYEGTIDPNFRAINEKRVDLDATAAALPDLETAEFLFQEQLLNAYGPDLAQTLHIADWNDGIVIRK
jgi:hypothetical protein